MKKGELMSYITQKKPDVICLNETKIDQENFNAEMKSFPLNKEYTAFWYIFSFTLKELLQNSKGIFRHSHFQFSEAYLSGLRYRSFEAWLRRKDNNFGIRKVLPSELLCA